MGIITTEQQEQQQREKDEKLRADIRKSLDVDTDSAGIVESLYKRIPTNARLLLENIAGVDTPITAEDFTKDELVEMVFLAEKQKQYNKRNEEMIRLGLKDEDITKENFDYLSKRAKTYEDTRGKTSVNPYKEVGDEASAEERLVDKGYLDSIVDSFTDPRYGVATTLGKYTALDENGKISRIKDTYNFNKKQRNLPTDFIGAVKRIMISPELAGEYLANALGTEDREVDIKLPRKMKEGGMAKRMARQMELFEPVERGFNEGGLVDEGGMIDEQSGNEVPPGSLREEVRDDIPAQLSEGEFVMPADVVRYHGLDKMMALRDEAKAGLQRMEAMGQMGNADEATIPDGVPFNVDDLEIEDEQEELNFQVGGVVTAPGTGIAGQTPAAPSTTGFTPLPPAPTVQTPITAASATASPTGTYQPELAGTKFTPTTIAPVTPTFQQTIGAGVPGVDFEYVTYVNEAGQTIRLRKSKSTGELIDPIPEGYRLQTEETQTTETSPTTVATTRTTDRDDSGKDDGGSTPGASISLGGSPFGPSIGGGIPGTRYAGPSRAVKGATTFDVSFDVPGTLPGVLGAASLIPSMLSKTGGLPKDATATLTSRGTSRASVKLSADVYNKVRNDPRGKLAKDITDVMNKVDSFAEQGATNEDLNNAYAQNSVDRATRAEDVRQANQLEGAARDRAFDDIIDREVKAAEESESYAEQQGAVTSATTSTPQGTVTGMIDEYDEPAPDDSDSEGCFAKGTLVTMADGSKKSVEQIDIGDSVEMGGFVFAVGKFLINNLYEYKGIHVSGSHMVYENGMWLRVEDSPLSNFVSDEDTIVYVFGSENRRIVIENTVFTDYFEVHEQEKLKHLGDSYFTSWKENAKITSKNNVQVRNASNVETEIMAAE